MNWITENSFLKWLVVVLLLFNIVTITTIWLNILDRKEPPPMREENTPPPDPMNLMKKELNLSNAQMKIFEERRKQIFSVTDSLFNNMRDLKKKLTNQFFKEDKNPELVDSITHQIGEVQSKLEKLRFDHFKGLLAICTPEQKEKFIPVLKRIMEVNPPDEMHHDPRFQPGKDRHGEQPSKPDFMLPFFHSGF